MRAMTAKAIVFLLAVAALAPLAEAASAYEVRITNLTKLQTFTPILVVSHAPSVQLFEPGAEASPELEVLAEAGDIGPLEALLGTLSTVGDTNTNGGLLGPGETTTIRIRAQGAQTQISLAGMLIPTNDTFVAASGIPIPAGRRVEQALALAYDAGTEANDQNCANIPGPRCGGDGLSATAEGDEGHIHVSNGFHDLGSGDGEGEVLTPFNYDWRNPVALIEVRRAVP